MKKLLLGIVLWLVFVPTLFSQSANFNNGFALINVNGGGNGFYCLQGACGVNPSLQVYYFGQIALDTGSLVLNGVEINNWTCGGANISDVDMFYRVFPFENPGGPFIEREIFFNLSFPNGCGGADMQWLKFADNNNLLAGITQPGVYEVELYVRQSTSSNGFQYMNNGGANYRARFEVVCSLSPLNGTYDIPSDCFPTMASAVNYLNTYGVSGPVTFNVASGYTETAPPGGFRITGTGTAANPVVIRGINFGTTPIFTASNSLTIGARNDAIFKLVGADFITLSNLILVENPLNTISTSSAENNMTEFGVAIMPLNVNNGAKNNIIRNCVIELNRDYVNTIGVYSNTNTTDNVTNTNLQNIAPTTADGNNSGLELYANEIRNVNIPIAVVGPQAAAAHNDGLNIGSDAMFLGMGNLFINYGTGVIENQHIPPNLVSGLCHGIFVRNTKNVSIVNNIFYSSLGGITNGQHRVIYLPTASNAFTGTYTNRIAKNTIDTRIGIDAALSGIVVETGAVNNQSTLIIENNTFDGFRHIVPATSNINYIFNSTPALNVNISGNNFNSNTVNTSGNVTFISNNAVKTDGSIHNVNNNSVANFSKTAAGGTLWCYNSTTSSTGNSVVENINGNTFENITVNGATVLNGIHSTFGNSATKTVNNNIFNTIVGGTGNVVLFNVSNSLAGGSIAFNTLSNITSEGEIQNITIGSGTQSIYKNVIHSATTSGTTISGIRLAGGSGYSVYQNKIYNLESTNFTTTLVYGISVTSSLIGFNARIYNNVIGDLKAPNVSSLDAIRGMSILPTGANSSTFISHNTIYLNTTSNGANFGTAGLFVGGNATATTNNHTLKNNLVVNLSTQKGTGRTSVLRRSNVALDNYNITSDHNAFYVGTPSASRVVFLNNTTPYQTLENFQTLVFPREQNSVYEEPIWESTNGADANYLKLQDGAYASQMESAGLLITTPVTIDFDHVDEVRPGGVGVVNGGGQQVDIGAYEFDAIPYDRIPPVITYIPLTGGCGQPEILFNNVHITDIHPGNVGVVTTGALVPRVYYRLLPSGAWQSQPGTLTSGDAFDGLWSFEITGLSTGNIEYFVIAQDNNGNLTALPDTDLVATDVLTITTYPSNPNALGFPVAVWNGSWTPAAPDSQTRAVIQAPYETNVNGSFEACDCIVEVGASVVIASGDYIQLQGGLTNQGSFTIQNSGSLVQVFDQPNVGSILVERIANNVNKYDYVYWSSPVQGYSLSNIIGTSSRFRWGPVTPNANGGLGNWMNYSGIMNAGEGYIVRAPNSFPIVPDPGTIILTSFTGVPHNGIIPVTIQRGDMTVATVPSVYSNPALSIEDDNFNLVGNPYPSAISAEDFLIHNAVTKPVIEGSLRLWTHGTVPDNSTSNPFFGEYTYNYTPNDYIIFNLSGSISGPAGFGGYVASGQGFFVLMNEGDAATATLEFTNDMRSSGYSNSQFYRMPNATTSAIESKHRIWLDLVQANGANARTLVGYIPGATYAKDVLYDAWVKPGNHLNMYSLADGLTLAIQGRPVPFVSDDIVPLGFVAPQSGNFSITIAFADGLFAPQNGQSIFLEDKLTGTIHLLNSGPYSFYAEQGRYDERFELRYGYEPLGTPGLNGTAFDVLVSSKQDLLTVKSQGSSISEIKMYDLYGRILFEERSLSGTEFEIQTVLTTKSTLMVVVSLENGMQVVKKVMH